VSEVSKYQSQATLGLLGIGIIALPIFFKLPSQFGAYNATLQIENSAAIAQSQTKASENVERSRIEQKKITADAIHDSGILPSGDKLKINNYTYDPKVDPEPTTAGYLADETVFLYDNAGTCVGKIANRKWLFKAWFQDDICKNSPAL